MPEKDKTDITGIRNEELSRLRRRCILALIFCAPLIIISLFFRTAPYADYYMWVLATPVVLFFGRQFFIRSLKLAFKLSANTDTLVALSTGTAYVVSVFNTLLPSFWTDKGMEAHVYFGVSAIILAFVLLGRYLEEKAKSNTALAIKKLMGLQPRKATVNRNGELLSIPVNEITEGDEIMVKPGERIPVDGKISKGSTFINESMISGEPLAVEKGIGKKVYGGTVNEANTFYFIVSGTGRDTLLGQVIGMIQDAQENKRGVQSIADKVSGVFIIVVGSIAFVTFLVWLVISAENGFMQGVFSAVAVLIMACPCALGLAVPTAIMAGIDKGSSLGILIKGSEALENADKLTAVVLDKTGTITEGVSGVTEIKWLVEPTPELKGILYGIESYSEHPLSNAVKVFLNDEYRVRPEMKVSSLSGSGLMGETKSGNYYVGTMKLLDVCDVNLTEENEAWINSETEKANTVVLFAHQSALLAIISITDKVKDSSVSAINTMKSSGLDLFILTGDSKRSGDLIARQVGIEPGHVNAGALPAGKASFVNGLKEQGEIVAMTGDGINDSGALAAADVSFAMGQGSDIAMEVAQVTIASSDLTLLCRTIDLSGLTNKTIRQNLFWAFIFNIIGIPVAAGILYPSFGILLDPVMAGVVILLSSVSVVINSLLLGFRYI
jgi:Cu2+-exporting ATPase